MSYFAVFLISLSALAFQVLLTRVFSIGQWNHLSFMVISIALFGFGASGTFLSILDTRRQGWEIRLSGTQTLRFLLVIYSLTVISAYMVLNNIPLDYFRLPIESVQAVYLLCAYLVLALPFFLTGMVISIAFAAYSKNAGLVYFSTMSGSALGAILPVPLLPFLEEGILVVLCALIPLLFLLIPSRETTKSRKTRYYLLWCSGAAMLVIGIFLIGTNDGRYVKVRPSPYKSLSQILNFPDTHIVRTVSGIRGRIDTVESPYIRFAPGLSLKFQESLPKQSAIFQDADSPYTLYEISTSKDTEFARYSLSYAGYTLSPRPAHVLVIQGLGGSGIPFALASEAKKITVLEPHPETAKIVSEHYPVNVINVNPRKFFSSSGEKYSMIHIENHGPSIPGTAALNQEHLLTVDALVTYLNHLDEKGAIILSGKLILPPANTIRLWASAYEALRYTGKKQPGLHMAMLRNWDMFTLIISAGPIQNSEPLTHFARNMNFDMVYLPKPDMNLVNRFNVFDKPHYFDEIEKLKTAYGSGTENLYFSDSLLDIAPQWDNRPFPNRFLKWPRLMDLYESTGSRLYGLLLSGEIVVAVVFIEAVLVAFFLLAIPIIIVSKKRQGPKVSHLVFFLGIGAGFMFAELYFIKQYTFLFGNPVIAFTVVLSGILLFSGAGGYLSQKMNQIHLKWSLVCLACVFIGLYIGFDHLIDKLPGLSNVSLYITAFLILSPIGLLMGIPFSIGMRLLLNTPLERAYAWAANGCASVPASIAAAQVAISQGIPPLILTAAVAYFLSLWGCKMKKS
jgi:hypothetical protein